MYSLRVLNFFFILNMKITKTMAHGMSEKLTLHVRNFIKPTYTKFFGTVVYVSA